MICPHCGNDTEASPVYSFTIINNAGAAQPAIYPVVNVVNANALNPSGQPWSNTVCAAANACNPFPLVTYIKL